MAKGSDWVKTFRDALKAHCPGWTIFNDRGRMRLQVGKKPSIKSITLPYRWKESDWIDAFNRCQAAATAYNKAKGNIDIRTAFQLADSVSSKTEINWHESLREFREFKTRVKDSTWKTKYRPVLNNVIRISSSRKPAENGPDLCKFALKQWKKGTPMRRHMRIALYAFLEFCVQRRDFPSLWLPPAMSDDEVVSTEKRIGYPMTDAQILRLIDSFPTDETGNKWRFACQLMAVYGLRPEDLRHLHTRNGGKELWSSYQKSMGGKKGQKTQPRQLFPLWVHDVDEVQQWKLLQRVHIKEPLPSLGQEGKAGEACGTYLRRKAVWTTIRKEAELEKQQLTPYSFRHRYAYYGHNRPKADGSHRPPKQVADALGHSLDTHLLSYARFMTRDLAGSFDVEPKAA